MSHKLYIFLFLLGLAVGGLAGAADLPPSVFFVANDGQWEEPFAFKLSVGGTTYFVMGEGLTIDIRQYGCSAARACCPNRFWVEAVGAVAALNG